MDISKVKKDNMGLLDEIKVHDVLPLPQPYAEFKRLVQGQKSITAVISDILDELGYQLMIPESLLHNVVSAPSIIVGRAITLRYLPERKTRTRNIIDQIPSRLAHGSAFRMMGKDDVLVIDGGGRTDLSVLGGLAASSAKKRDIQAVFIHGACRDVEEISAEGLPVWAMGVTPITGKQRLQAIEINGPVSLCDIQVCHNDITVADRSGVVFIPPNELQRIVDQLRPLLKAEKELREGNQ
jgi:4-hydroxy-4-methyl-2-oxoglutarate aldolase